MGLALVMTKAVEESFYGLRRLILDECFLTRQDGEALDTAITTKAFPQLEELFIAKRQRHKRL